MTFKNITALGRKRLVAAATGLALAITAGSVANSATVTDNMTVQITIAATCAVTANTLTFTAPTAPITANIDNQTTVDVTCTNTTPYNVLLGGGVAADVANRTMVNGGEDVAYSLFRDAGRTLNWGETIGTDTLSSTGTGAVQNHIVYGRVPPQTTPSPNTYTDTVLVTVDY